MLVGLVSCEVDEEQQGRFIIVNESGYAVTLNVFSTQHRRRAPVVVTIAQGESVERRAYGGAGVISYPELFFQGDSVQVVFSSGKRILHYCTQAQQLANQCQPAHSLLALDEYQAEPVSKSVTRYTYTLTSADYNRAY